jgi:alpha-amylase/alpha-mannosidase (GH57 family)
MNRYICVHGHFYQPPRENAWLEAIEQQESAYPYHDWNERITAECYAPNVHARILDGRDRIVRIVNNCASISYNFGPTLLAWLEHHAPEPYERIIEADRLSSKRFGHGSALAQAYNHLIMPLATERDRRTQTLWAMRDFAHRFGRVAEGMWLPETAVDTPTLETLAAHGVQFTVLAPRQAASVRTLGAGEWTDVSGSRVDPRRPYVCRLPSGASIALIFYDGPVSQGVAFEGLLQSGERFARRIMDILRPEDNTPQLAHIATDGETYGHHHRHGEMALAYALRNIEIGGAARLTNYASFLAAHPPTSEVRIVEQSSWSCVHGVERWRGNCGCHTGGRPGWTQAWRAPLRAAFDWLRDELEPRFESAAGQLVRDPWAARDGYIDVVLDRSPERLARFMDEHAARPLREEEMVTLLKLLEMQRHAMLMYTSCGWFFNDVAGIESVQVLQFAGRAAQLAEEVFGDPVEPELLTRLESAKSNVPAERDGRYIYETHVRPARVDLLRVAAHRAVSALFNGVRPEGHVYCYDVSTLRHDARSSDGTTIAVGRATVTSRLTREMETLSYAVLHFGNHHVSGGIRRHASEAEHDMRAAELLGAFSEEDLSRVVALLADFPEYGFSLKSLFADRQREILHHMLDARIDAAEHAYRQVYDANADLMRYLIELDLPLPRALTMAAEFVLNRDLRRALDPDTLDLQRTRSLLESANAADVPLDAAGLAYVAARAVSSLVAELRTVPGDADRLERLAELTALVKSLPFDVDLWAAQNEFYALVEGVLPDVRKRAQAKDESAARWVQLLRAVGDQLTVAVP